MDASTELGDFLKSRRAALRPEDVGIATEPARRRVAGLRREELALLAGVSVTHYTRLEQGRAAGVSDSVLDAIARALCLTEDETARLKHLARPAARRRPAAPRAEHATPSARRLLAAMTDVPALLLDRRGDVLAWNRLGHALLAPHLPWPAPGTPADRPNLVRMLFLDERHRALHADWKQEAHLAVAALRLAADRHPDDRALAELIGRLSIQSEEFTALWARRPARTRTTGGKSLRHPAVGTLELGFENLSAGATGQRLIAYTAEPGSPSDAALRLLAATTAATTASTGPGLPALDAQ
ncbi:helix-turn-helix transcriptional regulator [Streptomyces sp. Go40/10]|uniref:helix-turn-helix domain-containing protein n=1 Tax=Streptomyces sp. Go40/10 TaxID=2825844 RepID=UPI001E5C0486|nr:helix-turn-helix transcriptional regulator [Streptomyces sp. Go40/10]UFR03020.1 helix-turn-helix transcriptional regulator [Streptomyces sp. Go40/10]